MAPSSPKHITNLLSPGPGLLGTIINQIQLLKQLSRALKGHLPAPLDDHCRVAAVRQGTVIVHADSPAWATRLRYLAPTLASSLRKDAGYQWVRDIRIKVRPAPDASGPAVAPASAGGDGGQPAPGLRHAPAGLQRTLQNLLAKDTPTGK